MSATSSLRNPVGYFDLQYWKNMDSSDFEDTSVEEIQGDEELHAWLMFRLTGLKVDIYHMGMVQYSFVKQGDFPAEGHNPYASSVFATIAKAGQRRGGRTPRAVFFDAVEELLLVYPNFLEMLKGAVFELRSYIATAHEEEFPNTYRYDDDDDSSGVKVVKTNPLPPGVNIQLVNQLDGFVQELVAKPVSANTRSKNRLV